MGVLLEHRYLPELMKSDEDSRVIDGYIYNFLSKLICVQAVVGLRAVLQLLLSANRAAKITYDHAVPTP